jgi:hypothetical protein
MMIKFGDLVEAKKGYTFPTGNLYETVTWVDEEDGGMVGLGDNYVMAIEKIKLVESIGDFAIGDVVEYNRGIFVGSGIIVGFVTSSTPQKFNALVSSISSKGGITSIPLSILKKSAPRRETVMDTPKQKTWHPHDALIRKWLDNEGCVVYVRNSVDDTRKSDFVNYTRKSVTQPIWNVDNRYDVLTKEEQNQERVLRIREERMKKAREIDETIQKIKELEAHVRRVKQELQDLEVK